MDNSRLLVRGGMVVTSEGVGVADVRVEGEMIATVESELAAGPGEIEIDARGLTVFPGVVDIHVHFNEPGRTEWEGGATGSRALAAGGGTTFVDMPLNSTPCVVTGQAVADKRHALEAASITDFALWGGLVPGHLDDMAAMADEGVVGFKAFMCDSGLPEFQAADEHTLAEGMVRARRLDLPVAVHAESQSGLRTMIGTSADSFLTSRPAAAEIEAIDRVLRLAADTGAALHLVHVSTEQGVLHAARARQLGVDVSVETCPHYLTFTRDDLEDLGVAGKCAPPLRSAEDRQALWKGLAERTIDIIGSDHSPAPPAMKRAGDFAGSWGGIAGVQSTLAAVLTGHDLHALSLQRVVDVMARVPAERLRLSSKGAIAPGFDADLTLVDLSSEFLLDADDLLQRYPSSPYVGRRFRGIVRRVLRRGETIFADGAIVAKGRGRFLRPADARVTKEAV